MYFKKLKSFIFKSFKKKFNKSRKISYHLVSLGPNCYPKTVLTRWKLKTTKEYGEITLPFDLAWFHKASFITDFINNDFSDFFEDIRYMQHVKSWDNYEKVNFSHEKNFGPDDKYKLVDMYKKRIDSFINLMDSDFPVLFLQILKDEKVGEDVKNLCNILKTKRGTKPFEFVVVDCIDVVKDCSDNINILKAKPSTRVEDFYAPSFYRSKEGKAFEKQIIDYCEYIIKHKLKCKVVKFL